MLVAEFDSPEALCGGILALRKRGLEQLDVYMPYPDKAVLETLGLPPSPLPRFVFVAGLVGATLAYSILWFTNVYDFPLNVGGHPQHPIPAFIPISFETLVLFAGITSFVGALLLGGLPRLYHPIDELEGLERVTVDRFLLCLAANDKGFDEASVREALTHTDVLDVRWLNEPEKGAES